MSLFGVYISGPGIVGEMLMHELPGRPILIDCEPQAKHEAELIQFERPYHHVFARQYVPGDESRGFYAKHPDGVTE